MRRVLLFALSNAGPAFAATALNAWDDGKETAGTGGMKIPRTKGTVPTGSFRIIRGIQARQVLTYREDSRPRIGMTPCDVVPP
jgi:hypothetical protein